MFRVNMLRIIFKFYEKRNIIMRYLISNIFHTKTLLPYNPF